MAQAPDDVGEREHDAGRENERADGGDQVVGAPAAVGAVGVDAPGHAGEPDQVNAVAMRDFTEDEVARFCELARSTDYQVRFIEFMPLDGDRAWKRDAVLTGAEFRALIEERHPLEEVARERHATARVYRFRDGTGEIGFINPVSEPFCGDCNRIRLTADGKLRTCLFSIHETDLREPLRAGASDAELERVVRDAVWRKGVNEPGFRPPPRTMSAIGG